MATRFIYGASTPALGYELYTTTGDGTTATLVDNLFVGPTNGVSPVQGLGASLGEQLLFEGNSLNRTQELWTTDGTAGGTFRLADINPGVPPSIPMNFAVSGDLAYFAAYDGIVGQELWTSDGTVAGTMRVIDINPIGDSEIDHTTAFGDGVLFVADDGTTGNELWYSDGTAAGTNRLTDTNPGLADGDPFVSSDAILGDLMFFAANDPATGRELYVTDGTAAGTLLLKELAPGAFLTGDPTNFTAMGGKMYFSASDGTNGIELWASDGTALGTNMIANIAPGPLSSIPTGLVALGKQLLFVADDGAGGRELWRYEEGGPATKLLDINPGVSSAFGFDVDTFFQVGEKSLVFAATDSVNGVELWVTDGTEAGTMALGDLNPGAASFDPSAFFVSGDRVYFQADDGTTGIETWVTDGTAAGTTLVNDTNAAGDGYMLALGEVTRNDAPTIPELSFAKVEENAELGTLVGTISSTDSDGDPLTFALTDDAGGLFALDGDSLITAGDIDFETAANHSVTITVDDGQGGTAELTETITVRDLPEGTSGDDTLVGSKRADKISGLQGDDTVSGRGGDDILKGGKGSDDLLGQGGADDLRGGSGGDRLLGGGGDDSLAGGKGADLLKGKGGDDDLFGGFGRDTLKGGGGADDFTFQDAFGKDKIRDFDGTEDSISLVGFGLDFTTLDIRDANGGADTEIQITAGDRILLSGVDSTTLTDDMFSFS